MKTIAVNSIKGGTGKSTLSVLFINALISAGYKCLVIDADASNNSLSFYFDDSDELTVVQGRTIFDLFLGAKAEDCTIRIRDNLTATVHGSIAEN
jgi:chromosome partitioning protein